MKGRNITMVACGLAGSFLLGWWLNGPSDRSEAAAGGKTAGGPAPTKGWTKGKGWGPWGKEDEVGSLNAMTPATIKAALDLVKTGKVYDLGASYDAESFKWPGRAPGAIVTYRGPEGIRRQGDFKPAADP